MNVATADLDTLREELLALPAPALERHLRSLNDDDLDAVTLAFRRPRLLPHQIPPTGDWWLWILEGGRGSGKSQASSVWFDQHMTGPPCDDRLPGGHRGLIAAPTGADGVQSCYEGPSGLKVLNPSVRIATSRSGTNVYWPNGAQAVILGAHGPDDIERFRSAGNRCCVWAEELAAWRQLEKAWQVMDLGVRTPTGRLPQFVASTTPKPRKFLKELRGRPGVARTHGRTSQNPFLDAERRAQLYSTYGGTRMGMQELEGLYIDDVEGALWSLEQLEATRVGRLPDELRRVVIGVDPPGSTAECGIVAAGVGVADRHLYVFADYSLVGSPATWGAKVVDGYHDARADKICVERNYGGDMVRNTIRTAQGGESLPIKDVSATRGKVVRAEPVAALFEVERHGGPKAHLVGHLPGLEEQLTNWVPNDGQSSPDRLDAMVWAATELMPGMLHRPGKATGRQIAEARLDV